MLQSQIKGNHQGLVWLDPIERITKFNIFLITPLVYITLMFSSESMALFTFENTWGACDLLFPQEVIIKLTPAASRFEKGLIDLHLPNVAKRSPTSHSHI